MKRVYDTHGWKVFAQDVSCGGWSYSFRVYYEMKFICVIGMNSIGHVWPRHVAPGADEDKVKGAMEVVKFIGNPEKKIFTHVTVPGLMAMTFIFDEREQEAARNHEPIDWQKVSGLGKRDADTMPEFLKENVLESVFRYMKLPYP